MTEDINKRITVIVNSCDDYRDLWMPFFTLYKKYWAFSDMRLILNTESEEYKFDGLNIECIHPPESNISYGKRMQFVLSQVTTPYVIPLLDDFFLRKPVDFKQIEEIVGWMDSDKSIVYFNCDHTPTYIDLNENRYKMYHRLPCGNSYFLNMQAAIWRTNKLQKYWKYDVTPWEWELYTNLVASRNKKEKFYCVSKSGKGFCDYGYDYNGMGVFRGKWVKEDVEPLFNREGIKMDFTKRGFYKKEEANSDTFLRINEMPKTLIYDYTFIERVLGKKYKKSFKKFIKKNALLNIIRCSAIDCFIEYSLYCERKKVKNHFLNKAKIIRLKQIFLKN